MIPLARAQRIAGAVADGLREHCDRIEIAGSIRRLRPYVNDIDLVILPKPGHLDQVKARCEARCHVVTDGAQNYIVRMRDGTQLDIFFARHTTRDLLQTVPGNFGTLLLCRTGSKEHNIWLVEHAKQIGLQWKPYTGVVDAEGYVIAAEDEAGILKALNLDWIEPKDRER